ncbi:MAG: hypothetical protein ACRDZX_02995 [Acidimicrobiales bacterium]
MSRSGYLDRASVGIQVTSHNVGDLEVLAVVNDSWPDQVVSVSGGGISDWARASAPFYDPWDNQVLQVWYGTVTAAKTSTVRAHWDGTVADADVAEQEFHAAGGKGWAVVGEAGSRSPFPALTATGKEQLYFAAAMAWGNAAAGTTPGVNYHVPSRNFLFASDTNVGARESPTARGGGSIAVLFTPSGAGAGPGPGGPATTTTLSPGSSPRDYGPTPTFAWHTSMFAEDVQSWPVDKHSGQFAAAFVADYKHLYGSVGVNTLPLYLVPAGQAKIRFGVAHGCTDFLGQTGARIPIPAHAHLNGSSDNPVVVYQPSSGTDWELWKVSVSPGGTYSACWGGKLGTARSDGVFPAPYGLSATGISYLATTVTEADVKSGSINHAVAVILPRCNWWVRPADRGDCGSDPGQPSEGQWFRFPEKEACPPAECTTPFARMVFRAIQRYGMVVVDQGGAVMIEAEQPSDWAAQGHRGPNPIEASWQGEGQAQVVASLPWSDLQVVDPPPS